MLLFEFVKLFGIGTWLDAMRQFVDVRWDTVLSVIKLFKNTK